jgi:hypothetical protein
MNETSIVPVGTVIKDEEYTALLDEIRATEAEHSFAERMERVYMYHDIGCLIRDYKNARNVGVTEFIRELHRDLKYAERSLWFAKDCAEKWPTREALESALPDGKATSWTKVKALLGNGEQKNDDTMNLTKVAQGLIKRYGLDNAKVVAGLILSQ